MGYLGHFGAQTQGPAGLVTHCKKRAFWGLKPEYYIECPHVIPTYGSGGEMVWGQFGTYLGGYYHLRGESPAAA